MERDEQGLPVVQAPAERTRLREIGLAAKARLAAALAGLAPEEIGWLADTPLEGAVAAAIPRPYTDYFVVAPPMAKLRDRVAAAGGDGWLARYSGLLLLALLSRLELATPLLRVPAMQWPQIEDGLKSMLDRETLGEVEWAGQDFLKDVQVAQLRMIPTEGSASLALRLQVWHTLRSATKSERLSVVRYFGRKTFKRAIFQTGHSWHGFTADRPAIRRTALQAALVSVNPELLGALRAAWMLDPALEAISPHLYHRGDGHLGLGGRRFRMQSDEETIRDATKTSKTRREAYEQGRYLPTTYGIFVRREAMVHWVKSKDFESALEE